MYFRNLSFRKSSFYIKKPKFARISSKFNLILVFMVDPVTLAEIAVVVSDFFSGMISGMT